MNNEKGLETYSIRKAGLCFHMETVFAMHSCNALTSEFTKPQLTSGQHSRQRFPHFSMLELHSFFPFSFLIRSGNKFKKPESLKSLYACRLGEVTQS